MPLPLDPVAAGNDHLARRDAVDSFETRPLIVAPVVQDELGQPILVWGRRDARISEH